MKAEIISVGTELLLGHTINTDASFVARELSNLGISLLFSCVVGDNPERLDAAVREALERSDILITTGGLGPTDDDLTKETVARAAGVGLKLDEESLRHIEEFFKGRSFGENQRKQAMLPEGSTVLENNAGTAPGCAFTTSGGKTVIMLPGPPSELIPMLRDAAVPYLKKLGDGVICSRMIRTFGIGEGAGAKQIEDLTRSANPTAATYAKECEMFVRVTAKASSMEVAESMCDPVVEEICRRYGDAVYGIDVESLESLVVSELTSRKLSLSAAESCTGGLLAKRITDIPGSSAIFMMGAVTYSDEAKMRLLGVPRELLAEYGAVSEPVARAMAEGIQRLSGSSIGISSTGIAGPTGGTPEKPVGLVYIGLHDGRSTWVYTMKPFGRTPGREWIRERAAGTALDMIRRYICKLPLGDEREQRG